MKLIGFRKGEFTDQSTGRKVQYANVYFTQEANGVDGLQAVAYKATQDLPESLKSIPFGTECKVYFDSYKRVNLVLPVK